MKTVRMHPLDPNVRACLWGALRHDVVIERNTWAYECSESECWHRVLCVVCNRPLRRLDASDCPDRIGRDQ